MWQGWDWLGEANISPKRVAHPRKLSSPEDRRRLIEDVLFAPA
jgi:hypothetical protein